MLRYSYLIVEGPHDAEFVGRFLKLAGISAIENISKLDSFWKRLVPTEFPHGGHLLDRVPVPFFFSGKSHSVAISTARSDSRIAKTLQETLAVVEWEVDELEGLGIILDADKQIPMQRFQNIRNEIQKKVEKLMLPNVPGRVDTGTSPRSGIFILPDNNIPGTLEDLLIQCSEVSYPRLLAAADVFINEIESEMVTYTSDEKRDFLSPSGVNKATVGSVANVLKPGKSIQVSIHDNRWVTAETLMVPEIYDFNNFIRCLLNI